jgi:hypothetical protein
VPENGLVIRNLWVKIGQSDGPSNSSLFAFVERSNLGIEIRNPGAELGIFLIPYTKGSHVIRTRLACIVALDLSLHLRSLRLELR